MEKLAISFLIILSTFITIIFCLPTSSELELNNNDNNWKGKWFPKLPNASDDIGEKVHIRRKGELLVDNTDTDDNTSSSSRILMGTPNDRCDNGKDNLAIDFDSTNVTHRNNFICMDNSTLYHPNSSVKPILEAYLIPPEYMALHKCMNETISYDYQIPTFGTHRPIWPVYGEYQYVPAQRWIHNLEHGAVVLLYHPCANKMQLDQIRTIVKQCLYRHIITASERLSAERPFALVTWGKSFEFSVIDQNLVMEFIKTNALKGPEKISRDGQYNETLIEPAKLLTTVDDDELCPNMNV